MREIRFFKIITGILACAIFALFYVHQEVEIVKTSFLINKHRHEVSLQLDQYRSLVYNLSRLESPRRIEDTLCMNEISLCMPRFTNRRAPGRIELAHDREGAKKEKATFLAHILDRFSAKAEAKVVK
jgi:hypothetical protein